MRNLLALIGLGAILFAGWTYRDKIPWRWKQKEAAQTEVSAAAAESAERKLERSSPATCATASTTSLRASSTRRAWRSRAIR